MANTAGFWKKYSQAYDRVIGNYSKHKVLVLEHAKALQSYHRILDSGCGPGHLAQKLLEGGHEVYGIDINPEALRIAKRRCKDYPLFIPKLVDANKLPFENGYFDGISSMLVLWAIKDPRRYLIEHRRVLRSNGLLVLSGPGPETKASVNTQVKKLKEDLEEQDLFPSIQKSWDAFLNYTSQNIDHTGDNWFSHKEIKTLLENTGYKVLSIKSNPIYLNQGHIVTARKS